MSPSPLDHGDLRYRVSEALREHIATQRTRMSDISPKLIPLVDALEEFLLDGGKRLRPAFAYWGWRGAGGQDTAEVIRAVAAFEWVQACALIHDDVMDASDTRRGNPAIHRRFSATHVDAGWGGDADRFGTAAAILLGDVCLIWADEMLNTSGMDTDALLRAQPVYDQMRAEIMAGQYLDVLGQAAGDRTVSSAMTVVRYKSAKYTVERPLHFGAALAGVDSLVPVYSAYGLPLGEAFQLRDDVLGVFGDPDETGKPAGDDVREGKRTVLIAKALERADSGQAAEIERHLGNPELDGAGVSTVRTIIAETGALAETEKMISELTDRALGALHTDQINDEAADVLRELAVAATSRRV